MDATGVLIRSSRIGVTILTAITITTRSATDADGSKTNDAMRSSMEKRIKDQA